MTFDGLPNDGEPGEGDNVAGDIESVVGSAANDDLRGDARVNALSGGSGEDDIAGGAGIDTLAGGSNSDTLRARDRTRDLVSCGAGRDLVIADPADVVRDCEWVDRGTRRRPALARDALLRRTRGTAALRLPGARRFVSLPPRLAVPLGSTVDAAGGAVRVTGAADRAGDTQVGVFSGGAFTLSQRATGRRQTVLRLTGGSFRGCRSARGPAARRPVRHVLGHARKRAKKRRGGFRTIGRYASAGVRGTRWLMEDRCEGTYTRVYSGRVAVRDVARRRTIMVAAGRSYLARAPRR